MSTSQYPFSNWHLVHDALLGGYQPTPKEVEREQKRQEGEEADEYKLRTALTHHVIPEPSTTDLEFAEQRRSRRVWIPPPPTVHHNKGYSISKHMLEELERRRQEELRREEGDAADEYKLRTALTHHVIPIPSATDLEFAEQRRGRPAYVKPLTDKEIKEQEAWASLCLFVSREGGYQFEYGSTSTSTSTSTSQSGQARDFAGCASHSTDSVITAVDHNHGLGDASKSKEEEGKESTDYPQPDLDTIATQMDTLFRERYKALLERGGRKMKIVAVIGSKDKGCMAYARTIERCCTSIGVEFERKELETGAKFEEAKAVVEGVNGREDVDGMIVLTPIFGGLQDEQLRGRIAPHLDVEALSPSMAERCTSVTPIPFQRVFDNHTTTRGKAGETEILFPCTPMSVCTILMSLESIWDHSAPIDLALRGKYVTIINRSAVFGKPLALMLANVGANVYSIDINDIILFHRPSSGAITSHPIDPNEQSNSEIFSLSDIIISAVPSPNYRVAISNPNIDLKPGVGLINVATGENFCERAKEKAGWYIPRVGAITRRCLMMNALMGRMTRDEGKARVHEGTKHEER